MATLSQDGRGRVRTPKDFEMAGAVEAYQPMAKETFITLRLCVRDQDGVEILIATLYSLSGNRGSPPMAILFRSQPPLQSAKTRAGQGSPAGTAMLPISSRLMFAFQDIAQSVWHGMSFIIIDGAEHESRAIYG